MCFLLITVLLKKKNKTKKQNKTKKKKQKTKNKTKTKKQLKKTTHETMNFGSSNLTKPKKKSNYTIKCHIFTIPLFSIVVDLVYIFIVLFYFILTYKKLTPQ